MDNNAFDEALRRVVANEKLPYADEAWTRMHARLDAHSDGKKRGFVVPLPVIRWAAAAAVIVLALAAGWWLRDTVAPAEDRSAGAIAGSPGNVGSYTTNTAETSATPTTSSVPSTPARIARQTESGVLARPTRDKLRSSALRTSGAAGTAQSSANNPMVAGSTNEVPIASPEQTHPMDAPPVITSPPRQKSTHPQFALVTPDEAPKAAARTGFDLSGGYGYGGEVPAFSVGVAVRRPLSSRLHVEGALALVGTTPDPIGSSTKSDDATPAFFTPGEPGITGQNTQAIVAAQQAAAAEAEYEELRARQLYVQAAPVLMYRVVGGLSAGGGLDAQRRVSTNTAERERSINSFTGVSVPALPEWDFGLALRADYNVTKAVRLGVQYRESLRAISANGAATQGRNYWLLQAGFRIR